MITKVIILLLLSIQQSTCCFNLPVTTTTAENCVETSTVTCDYVTVSNLIFNLVKGACTKLIFDGAPYKKTGLEIYPAEELTAILTVDDLKLVQSVQDYIWAKDVQFFVGLIAIALACSTHSALIVNPLPLHAMGLVIVRLTVLVVLFATLKVGNVLEMMDTGVVVSGVIQGSHFSILEVSGLTSYKSRLI